MCAIAGFVDFSKKSSKEILQNMTDIMHHRGPDDSGYYFDRSYYADVGLGHRRLSILDLSIHGHQPMSFDSIEIVYNGEVYNFYEIREELERDGYSFISNSDTEVILKAYHKWGLKAIDRFRGMFSIAIYDRGMEKLFLIRDRAGVKPLYWYQNGDTILFASELKSFSKNPNFKREIDIDALSIFLELQYIPEPYSIFKNSHKLKAGHILEVDLKSRSVSQSEYWSVVECYNRPKLDISEDEAILECEKILSSSFSYRLISDVPVGIFLSGGYDSSIVAALLQKDSLKKLKTFTIGFYENGFNEAPYAKEVASYLGCDHLEYYCTPKDALDIIPKLPTIYDEPFADASSIPTTLVSKLAKNEVTVSLSADGGDEIFAGYDRYTRSLNYYKNSLKIPSLFRKTLSGFIDRFDPFILSILRDSYSLETRYKKVQNLLDSSSIVDIMRDLSSYISFSQADRLLKGRVERLKTNFDKTALLNIDSDNIDKMLAIDYKTYMVDGVLTKVDRATMSVALEGREPFLDHKIIEFIATLPSSFKYKNGVKKYILKELTHKYIPKELMDRPKMGFGVPIKEWFKDELKEYFLYYLDRERLEREGIFNVDEVLMLRDNYLNSRGENVDILWSILIFEMWYERWMS